MHFLALASLISLASGVAVDLAQRPSPLSVAIEVVGNSEIKATVTNSGDSDLKLLKTGSILDSQAVEKTEIMGSGSSKIPFDGLRLTIATHNLPADAFVTLKSGASLSTNFDVAAVHDLSAGGSFSITSAGFFSYASSPESLDIAGALPFTSNTVTASVDGAAAAIVRRNFHENLAKRTAVQSDCTGTRRTATTNARAALIRRGMERPRGALTGRCR
ncbi:metallo-endopeptidase [Magnaporthiopsis poae ATCC 64411]|uniref:Metallo-endopeptidase n=1 Tax=Magnaporthiopsis poae (strain ATCC 64411 / 73-15) TaxID=644358 RepID=A0A0C4EC86_MAGP6|nr:metallo-endopeptidase [Magnaporthiopsis poae ATCC 64411]